MCERYLTNGEIWRLCFVIGAIVVVGIIEYGNMLKWNRRWAVVVQMLGYLYGLRAIRFIDRIVVSFAYGVYLRKAVVGY